MIKTDMKNIKASNKFKITKKLLDDLPSSNKRYYIWDSELPNFGVAVQKTGYKSYFLDYTTQDQKRRRIKIAIVGEITPDEARKKAYKHVLLISQGSDPLDGKQLKNDEPTFKDVAEEYIEKHAIPFKKATSIAGDREMLRKHILPFFEKISIKEVKRADIKEFHYQLREKKYTANRCVQLLSKMMNLCEEWGYRPDGSNPCKGLKKYKEDAKERFLTLEEIKRLQLALDRFHESNQSPYFPPLIRLLLLTGARLSEILKCKWEYINFERKVIELPDSKTGKKEIILCDRSMTILNNIKHIPNNPYIIVSSKKEGTHFNNPRKSWAKLLRIAGLEGLRLHDLRHTHASIALMQNIPLEVIGKRLGHKTIQTTMRYAHLADSHLRKATDIVSNALGQAMGG
ncbi:MAG: hypothetical protein COA94_01120 [Rickettsiales bacterium]|nr:MAG: hypothetical protein COA94_01120 [Rickettsiales bacterium]